MTLVGGTGLMFLSLKFPGLVAPFAHGIPADGGYKYIRACYGVAVSGALAFGFTWFTRPRPRREIESMTIWGLARRKKPREVEAAAPARAHAVDADTARRWLEQAGEGEEALGAGDTWIFIDRAALRALALEPGDTVFVDDARWWQGGLRSARGRVVEAAAQAEHDSDRALSNGVRVGIPAEIFERNRWREGQPVTIERVE